MPGSHALWSSIWDLGNLTISQISSIKALGGKAISRVIDRLLVDEEILRWRMHLSPLSCGKVVESFP